MVLPTWIVLELQNVPKEDHGNSTLSALAFGQPVRLPGEFFDKSREESMPNSDFSDNLAKFISSIKFSPTRSARRPSWVDPNLLDPSTTHVYVLIEKRQPPLFPAFMGRYQVIKRFSKYFELNMRTHIDRVSIDRLKRAYLNINILNENEEELPLPSPPHMTSPVHLNFQKDNEPQDSSSSVHKFSPAEAEE